MTNILISGYYGFRNIGDEAILSCIIQELQDNCPDIEITVISGDIKHTKNLHKVKAISTTDLESIDTKMRSSDLVIVGGGGLYQEFFGHPYYTINAADLFKNPFNNIMYYAIVPLMSKMYDKTLMFYAQGVGPFVTQDAMNFYKFLFSFPDIITVRDNYSKKSLESLGIDPKNIIVTMDPVFRIKPCEENIVKEIFKNENIQINIHDDEFVCICLRSWINKEIESNIIDSISEVINKLLDQNKEIKILCVPFQTQIETNNSENYGIFDIEVNEKLLNKIINKNRCFILKGEYHPREICGIISKSCLLIGMRYHSLIFAAISRIPIIALKSDQKIKNLMDEFGLQTYAIDFTEMNSDEIFDKVDSILKDSKKEYYNHTTLINKNIELNPLIAISLIENESSKKNDTNGFSDIISGQAKILNEINLIIYKKDKQFHSEILDAENRNLNLLSEIQTTKNEHQITKNELKNELQITKNELQGIHSSKSWKFIILLRKCIDFPKSVIFDLGAIALPEWIKKPIRKILFRHVIIQSKEPLPDDLNQFITEVNEKGSKSNFFIILSGTKFVENEGQRPIKLAKELAKRGNYVLFAYWRWIPDECSDYGKKNDNIFIIAIDQLLNYSKKIIEFDYSKEVSKVCMMEFPHPYFFEFISSSNSNGWVTVYDVLDDWEEFHKVDQAKWFDNDLEQYFILNSDIITAVSPALVEKIGINNTKSVNLLPNAVDTEILSDKPARPLKKGIITIGYFGHLTSAWFDWDLIIGIANKHKDWVFHLIGYGAPQIELPTNVFMHGKVEPQELSSYVKNWDVAIIPFKISKLAASVDPIKIYEYLYFHLPVVVKGIPHLERFPYTLTANSFSEFEECIERAKNINISEIDDIIKNNTWEKRVDVLLEEIYKIRTTDSIKNKLFLKDET